MDISSSHQVMDRISELPNDILLDCLSLLEMKNAAQTSILSNKWRYLWTHLTNLDFDPELMYPEEFATFWENRKYETRKYFAWINQVVDMHRGPSIDKFRVHSRYVSSYATQIEKWIKFALSKRVKELVLDFISIYLSCDESSKKGYPFGFDMLKHPPCYTGITALQSLHLKFVNVSGEFVEFLLSHCHHLERLHLDLISVSNLRVKSSKLKYLTVTMGYRALKLEQLEIDAENLLYFEYDDTKYKGGPHMVFKSVPMLVETSFGGGFCSYPYPIFQKLSLFSNQLSKLSLKIAFNYVARPHHLVIPDGVAPIFPNVKHLTCTTKCYPHSCILSMKRFIEACPKLEEFKLQVYYIDLREFASKEASELRLLQGIDLEDKKEETTDEKRQIHLKLRILELNGFLGVSTDVELALAVASYACSLKTIICDPRGVRYIGTSRTFHLNTRCDQYKFAMSRARKLAKIVAPKVKLVII